MRKRFSKRLGLLLAVAIAGVAAAVGVAAPAQADTIIPGTGVTGTTTLGQTSHRFSDFTLTLTPACGQTYQQIYGVTLYYTVASNKAGLTVSKVTLDVQNNTYSDVTIGRKDFVGNNRSYSWTGFEQISSQAFQWGKTYTISPTYFSTYNGKVRWQFQHSQSADNGCNTGWRTLVFELQIV